MLIAVLALFSAGLITPGRAEERPRQPTFEIRGPTILAFFPPVTQKELDRHPDTNETLSDFQYYASQVLEPLSKSGVDFKQVYARSFRVTSVGRTTTFRPGPTKVGYYFVAPGKRPRVEYGVTTDDGLIQVATEYFGLAGK